MSSKTAVCAGLRSEGTMHSSWPHSPGSQRIQFRGIFFSSLSEAAIALVLEEFVPDFRVAPGVTYQVPLGQGRTVDFAIGETFIEYHPIRMPQHSRRKISRRSRLANPRPRRSGRSSYAGPHDYYHSEQRRMLAQRYYSKRRRAIDQNSALRGIELIVATSREEFYVLVFRRFAGPAAPTLDHFLALFWKAADRVARYNGLPAIRREMAR